MELRGNNTIMKSRPWSNILVAALFMAISQT
nr:MAG TPA: hypothetical protein [Caudoviricetes sp.]